MGKLIKDEELVEIIVKAIEDEPFFTKEILIPKIVSIIKAFRLRLSVTNFQKEGKPSDFGRLLIANEKHNLEKKFWKGKLQEIVGEAEMQKYYAMRDEEEKIWNNKNE